MHLSSLQLRLHLRASYLECTWPCYNFQAKNIRSVIYLERIRRPLQKKRAKQAPAQPLILFGDLKFVLDRKRFLAQAVVSEPKLKEVVPLSP